MLLEPEIEDLDRKKSDILGNMLYIIRIYNIRITYDAICELCAKKLIKMDILVKSMVHGGLANSQ